MQNEQLSQNKEREEKPQPTQHHQKQSTENKKQEKSAQQSLIDKLKRQLESITRQSAQKDKEITGLKSNMIEQGQKITTLQKQVDNLESLLNKMIKRKDIHYKRYFDEKSNNGVYRSYLFEGSEQYQSTRDKQMLLNVSDVNLGSSRKVETYLQNSRIGNLSSLHHSRRQQLLNCQNLKDVLKLPEYRN